MPGTSSIGGLISGLDTTTLISQLMAVSRRRIDVVVRNQGKESNKLAVYQKLNTSLADFKTKAEALKKNDTFNVFKAAMSTNASGFKADDFLTVSTTSDASPGTHTITFGTDSKLAQARQLSSRNFSSKTAALNLSGDFVINGKGISVSASDTLSDIATLINNANSGSNATGVSATVLTVSKTDYRLILTSDKTGADTFSLLDASSDTENILQELGLVNGTTAIKTGTGSGAQSDEFSNSGIAVGSLLGLTTAQSGTVTIGGTNVAIDLSSQSLTTIASTINAISGVNASVSSTTTDGVTTYRIDISGTTSFTDSNHILETLGILEGQQGSIAEVHTASAQNTETSSVSGTSITSGTTFALINTGSDSNNVTNGDTITITGTKHDGVSSLRNIYNFR